MEGPITSVIYVAEDGLVRHKWEERLGECEGREAVVGGWVGEHPHRRRYRGDSEGVSGRGTRKEITFEI